MVWIEIEMNRRAGQPCRSFYFLCTREIYIHYLRRRGDGTRSNINHSVQYALSLQNETKRMAVAHLHHAFMSSSRSRGSGNRSSEGYRECRSGTPRRKEEVATDTAGFGVPLSRLSDVRQSNFLFGTEATSAVSVCLTPLFPAMRLHGWTSNDRSALRSSAVDEDAGPAQVLYATLEWSIRLR